MSFLGIKVPHDVARLFASIEAPGERESTDSLHVTLLYLGKNTSLVELGKAVIAAAEVAEKTRPFRLTSDTRTSFPGNADGVPVICSVVSPELHLLRDNLKASLDAHEVSYSKTFPTYNPHVTLAYADHPVPDEKFEQLEWSAYEMVLWGGDYGDDRMSATFPFAFPKKAASQTNLLRLLSAATSK